MGRLRPFDLVAGIGGVMLLVSLFLSWYGLDVPSRSGEDFAPQEEYTFYVYGSFTGWGVFTVVDILLAALALAAIAVPVVTAVAKGPAKPVAIAVLATVATALAVLLVLWRVIDDPLSREVMGFELSFGPAIGAWVALAGALIAFVGAFGALKDESTPGAVPPDVTRRPAPPAAAA